MNHIYYLVWSSLQRAWVVTSEFTRAKGKAKSVCVAAVVCCGFGPPVTVLAESKVEHLAGDGTTYNADSNVGTAGTAGTAGTDPSNSKWKDGGDGGDGSASYEFTTPPGTTPDQNKVSVSNNSIQGGNGGEGLYGGKGRTSIGDGWGGNGGAGGIGGTGIIGDTMTITITKSGTIQGGNGGRGLFGGGAAASNGRGLGGNGGNGGNGGAAISGSNLGITNSGTIQGGNAGNAGAGGIISDNAKAPTNTNGGDGGNGGAAISGNNLKITNSGTIQGGNGGNGGSSGYISTKNSAGTGLATISGIGGTGGTGGAGIIGDTMTITNESGGKIRGGTGGKGGVSGLDSSLNGINGGNGGNGGAGISGNNLKVTNSGTIQGGDGGDGYFGSPVSGTGYLGGTGGIGGTGGTGISGNNLTITNKSGGTIQGGKGGIGGVGGTPLGTGSIGGTGGLGGTGGAGISGNSLTITNESGGTIQGGSGGGGGGGGSGGNGGNGGDGISGSNLTIINSGTIIRGTGGTGGGRGTTGAGGVDGSAIRLTGGTNSLTLETGSDITGDIILSATDADTANTLSIVSDAATAIKGNLTAGAYTGVSLSGKTVTFNGDATFSDNTSLTFDSLTGGTALKANKLSFSGTNIKGSSNITNWNQTDYTLATTTNGVSGTYNDKTENDLLTVGATNYAYVFTSSDSKNLLYGLKWNDKSNAAADAYGTFDLKKGATLTLGVALADNKTVTASNVNDWDGKSLTKAGAGTLILTGKNTYTGATTVSAGTLKTGVEDAFVSTSGVTVAKDATLNLGGKNQHINAGKGTLTNGGTVLINDAGAGVLEKAVTLYGDMINSGLVVINNGATNAGQTLAVDGNWTGYGGTVSLGTVLGGDDSLTDKLAISGNASGTTYVSVANEGGTGAQTLEGIELISTGSSTADAFVQRGRVVAGSYEYHLQKGSASGANMNNWYLTSQNQNAQTYRPERGSYASNLQAAATMFSMRLKDRQGGSVYTDPVTGERHESSLWVRSVGGHTEGRLSDGQSKYSANRMVFQLGGDVLNGSLGADDAWHLGLMGGYGKQYSNTHNNLSGYNSKGSVWGYSTGIYGTWYQNAKDKTGLYADSWLAWNWFDNSVKGDELSYEKYKSKGLTASLETGYVFHTGSYVTSGGMENNVYVTPQAQVLWSGVKADNHTEANGTTVEGRGSDNIQTRLGVRLSMTGQSRLDKDSVRQFEPFVEANWVYTAKDYGVKMGDSSAYLQGSRNVAELKTGVEGRVSENLSVWGSVAQQLGGNSYQDTQGMLGVKYAF
ncbi:TPA: autotransporter outer membrane beta-barrel domain-containing protein [Kluyvera ascorbata]|nr:autotransporter outer membrane beta-barrel domain-containing protein [Kluyvera ascorbata]